MFIYIIIKVRLVTFDISTTFVFVTIKYQILYGPLKASGFYKFKTEGRLITEEK